LSLNNLFLIEAFAVWRFAAFIVYDDGPFDCFKTLRDMAGVEVLGADGRPLTFFGKLFNCMWCTSVWIAFGITLFSILCKFISGPIVLLWPFALSGIVVIMDEMRYTIGGGRHGTL
jgi:hypothetical protein